MTTDFRDMFNAINVISHQLEDLWIEVEFYKNAVKNIGFDPDSLTQLLADAKKSDSDLRKRAQDHFSEMRQRLETFAQMVAFEDSSEGIDSTRKPS